MLLHLHDAVARARQVRRRRAASRPRRRARATRSASSQPRASSRSRVAGESRKPLARRSSSRAPLLERPLPDRLALPERARRRRRYSAGISRRELAGSATRPDGAASASRRSRARRRARSRSRRRAPSAAAAARRAGAARGSSAAAAARCATRARARRPRFSSTPRNPSHFGSYCPAVALRQLADELGLHRRERHVLRRARREAYEALSFRADDARRGHRHRRRLAARPRRARDLARRDRGRERDRLDPRLRHRRPARPDRRRGEGLRPERRRLGEGGAQARAERAVRASPPAREALDRLRPERLRPDARRDHLRLGDRRRARHPRAGRDVLRERGPDRVSPNFLPNVLVDTASGQLAISLGIKGPNYAIVSACATGSHAIGEAAELIKRGDADAVIAGGTEACIDPADPRRLHRDARARRRGRAPAARLAAVRRDPRRLRDRPRARARVLLEDWDRAEARGADIYAEVLGYGASNDAHHLAQPEPEADGRRGDDAGRARARRRRARAGRLHQRARHLDAARRPRRDEGDQGRLRRPRLQARRLLDEVDDGPHVRRGRRDRGDHVRPRAPRRRPAADDQLRGTRIPSATSTTSRTRRAHVQVDVALSNAMGLGGHNGCVLLGRAA